MSQRLTMASILLLSTALASTTAFASVEAPAEPVSDAAAAPAEGAAPASADPNQPAEAGADPVVDVSVPGAIVVVGRREGNYEKVAPQVVSVLSAADIKRTGEGNIAGSLQRVTGLSVVGGGYVYVRGLGDRYSSALLNGSPLPSPEPLKRVVPMDIFPTGVIASTLVQKSYSANYPGEFGGGVINLTTTAVPEESYLQIGFGGSWNSETTNQLGYTYRGGATDWSGFDNGGRDLPQGIADALAKGEGVTDAALVRQLPDARYEVLQRNKNIPANFSTSINGGMTGEVGDADVGMVFAMSYGNKWRTRDNLQQSAQDITDESRTRSFNRVITDNQITVNGLLGVGAEWNGQKLRWTTLYIRDTLKRGALSIGQDPDARDGYDYMVQDTAWYERQLIDTQLAGDFQLGPVTVNVRGSYANSQRQAPYENTFRYYRGSSDSAFINTLDNADGRAIMTFSDLNENLWSGGIDATYEINDAIAVTAGYAYSDTKRKSTRYELHFVGPVPNAIAALRPDYLLYPDLLNAFNVILDEQTSDNLVIYDAGLQVHGAYGLVNAELFPGITINAGARFESGKQYVAGFEDAFSPAAQSNRIAKDYWLPAATLTVEVAPQMQVRFSGSKTVARPQFRELIAQRYTDTESNRIFRGNTYLTDTTLWNADARWEYYFAPEQRASASIFYKSLKNPIETYSNFQGSDLVISFANAPKAVLYGAEFEVQKYVPLSGISDGEFFDGRRVVAIANYTYTKSKLKVGENDRTMPYTGSSSLASIYFVNGTPLTGQSDHIANFQLGLEDTDGLSQQTIMLSYASNRVTTRGPGDDQPAIVERPGFTLDFVARQGITLGSTEAELKLEARNITGRKYKEYQQLTDRRIYWNRYGIGTTLAASLSFRF